MMLRGLGWRPLRRGPWSFVTTRTLLRRLLLYTEIWPWRWLWHALPRRPLIWRRRCWPPCHRLRRCCGCGVCAYGLTPIFVGGGGDDHADREPFGGARGSWAANDLHSQVATGLLAAAALPKLIQLLHVEAGLLEQDVFWLYQDWPGLCLLAHKRIGKRMMTLQTNHSRR